MTPKNNMEPEKEVVVPETTEPAPEAEVVEETTEESVEEVKARLLKAEELANNYKIRAEKAEKKAKEAPKVENQQETPGDLTPKETIALIGAKVTEEEDINEVVEYARFKKISVNEALKSPTIKTILSERAEFRKTAQATATGTPRRGSAKLSEEAILSDASKNKLPDSDDGIEALALARQNARKNRKI